MSVVHLGPYNLWLWELLTLMGFQIRYILYYLANLVAKKKKVPQF